MGLGTYGVNESLAESPSQKTYVAAANFSGKENAMELPELEEMIRQAVHEYSKKGGDLMEAVEALRAELDAIEVAWEASADD